MGCLLKSGGCERDAADDLVQHVNRLQNTQYAYRKCLDIVHRETPQPETLYVNERAEESLVVERKSIAWPPNYAQGHAHDHFLADEISKELASLEFNELYCLQLPWLIDGNKTELRAFSKYVATRIRKTYSSLRPGKAIGSRRDPGRSWAFYVQPEEDREEDGPTKGIYYTWLRYGDEEALVQPDGPPPELTKALNAIYVSCVRKFSEYLAHRRILLLHPYGDLSYMPNSWWQGVFAKCPPPMAVNEIWEGTFYEEEGVWDFECLSSLTALGQ
jgi:hypothetical protein